MRTQQRRLQAHFGLSRPVWRGQPLASYSLVVTGKPSQTDYGRTRFNDALIEKANSFWSRDDFDSDVLVLLSQPMHAARRRQIRFSAEHHHTLRAAARGWQER